jgi:HEAT repeat protein
MRRLSGLIILIGLVLSLALLIPYGLLVKARMPALEFFGDFFSLVDSDSDIKAQAKSIPLTDLEKMLASSDAEDRRFAVRALGFREDRSAIPALVQSLDDNQPFRDGATGKETSVSEISGTVLIRIFKEQISEHPQDVGILIPLFTAAGKGNPLRRRAAIEILGRIREPLSKRLLLGISAEGEKELKAVAGESLAEFERLTEQNTWNKTVRNWQIQMVSISAIMILLLLWVAGCRLRDRYGVELIALSIAPIFLVGLFAAVIAANFFRGSISAEHIDSAVRHRDLVALKAMNYHDHTSYPGDSYVANYLLNSCNEDVIRRLVALPSVQTTDDESAVKDVDARTQWVLARFTASNLGGPRLEALINGPDAQIREVLASVLGKLGVRNERIIQALTRLTQDQSPRVRKAAEESMDSLRLIPVWEEFPGPS